MNIPGFNAEASLYNTTRRYRMGRVSDGVTSSGRVVLNAEKIPTVTIVGHNFTCDCYEDEDLKMSYCACYST